MPNFMSRLSKLLAEKVDDPGEPGPDDDALFDDPEIGIEEDDITLTAKGLHRKSDGFWYFPKFLKNADGSPKGEDGIYWYRKKRETATEEDRECKMIEEYVGKDIDSLPFSIPAHFMSHIEKLEAHLRRKADKARIESGMLDDEENA